MLIRNDGQPVGTDVSSADNGDLDDGDAEMPDPELDLGKSWHALHYPLTGTAWEIGDAAASTAILGGDEVGEDSGYGPARVLGPESVRAIAADLDAIDIDTLHMRTLRSGFLVGKYLA